MSTKTITLKGKDRGSMKKEIIGALRKYFAYRERLVFLNKAVETREMVLYPKFNRDNWPYYPITREIKRQIYFFVEDYLSNAHLFCDSRDLQYQCVFRLTTFDLKDVFIKGQEVDDYLVDLGAYKDWTNILKIDDSIIRRFSLNPKTVQKVILEQAEVIRRRLLDSPLSLEKLLIPSGIFKEPGWEIKIANDDVFAVETGGREKRHLLDRELHSGRQKKIVFKRIPIELAHQYHNDLHYIHSPRGSVAAALFLEDDDLPFSVVAVDRIDRAFKQNVLIMNGYNPDYCWDLTRLWSRPGTPNNTSSSMFSLMFNELKRIEPKSQAILSAFMPDVASGVSMTSGGFNNPVMAYPQEHAFGLTKYGMEHLVHRRYNLLHSDIAYNKWPLFPTLELMSAFVEPPLERVSNIEKYIVDLR